jgi:hypothetical protein
VKSPNTDCNVVPARDASTHSANVAAPANCIAHHLTATGPARLAVPATNEPVAKEIIARENALAYMRAKPVSYASALLPDEPMARTVKSRPVKPPPAMLCPRAVQVLRKVTHTGSSLANYSVTVPGGEGQAPPASSERKISSDNEAKSLPVADPRDRARDGAPRAAGSSHASKERRAKPKELSANSKTAKRLAKAGGASAGAPYSEPESGWHPDPTMPPHAGLAPPRAAPALPAATDSLKRPIHGDDPASKAPRGAWADTFVAPAPYDTER